MSPEVGVSITLPENWESLSQAERDAWSLGQIESIALDILADFGAAHGRVATSTQKEMYLDSVRPGIKQALRGLRR